MNGADPAAGRRRRYLPCLGLLIASALPAADMLLWTFDGDYQGWTPGNWETVEARASGIHGVTKYDCQLLSPPLSIAAQNYPEMVVRVRSSRSGSGEVFFNAPGGRMSDGQKVQHVLAGGPDVAVLRVRLAGAPGWSGKIERLRFDALNLAGAEVDIDFIALLPEAGLLLINGGAEIAWDGMPYGWTRSADAAKATLTADAPYAGARALRVSAGGAWMPPPVDLSFLGTYEISGYCRSVNGAHARLRITFTALDGAQTAQTEHKLTTDGPEWQAFRCRFEAPRMAAQAQLHLEAGGAGATADFDDIQIRNTAPGHITAPVPPQPQWSGAWIWHPELLDKDNSRAFFRRTFALPPGTLEVAGLQITVDDGYSLSINGASVRRAMEDIDGWRTPESIDLRQHLKPGTNDILVEAIDRTSAQGLLAELLLLTADGHETRVCSDRHWETAVTPDGPWIAAKELGTPPCQPWGSVPFDLLGRQPGVQCRLARLPDRLDVPGELNLRLEATAVDASPHGVYARVSVEQDNASLIEEWAPEALFPDHVVPGQHVTLESWPVLIPAATSSGDLTIRVTLVGANCTPPLPAATVTPVPSPQTGSFPQAEIRVDGHVPRLHVNGAVVNPTQALFIRPDVLHQRHARDAGIRVWSVALDDMGFREEGFDYTAVDQTLASYLAVCPDAWLLPTFTLDTRHQRWWLDAHPEARCRLQDGSDVIGDYHGGRRQVPSYGSAAWRATYGNALRQLIRHLKTTPFASRIIGFQPCSGISWEWFHWGSQSGELVDYSEAGVGDFRRWLTAKYGKDAALRQAWRDPDITLTTASVPTEKKRRTPARGIFYDPRTQQDVLDYHRYQHEVVAESILHFARIVKRETYGRCLFGTYYGYVMHLPETPGFCQGSGHFNLRRPLDSPDIDYLMAPVAYAWREVGGTAPCMTTAGSFPSNGKLFWNQADLRSHWALQQGHGRPPDLLGSIQCMRRELARCLATGTAVQWYDFSHGWTFGDDRLALELRRLTELANARSTARDWPLSDYLAVIVDETQMGTSDPFRPCYGLELIYRQREYLTRSGVPWRAYLFSDLIKHPELLEHKAFLFLNLFRLDPAQRDFLRDRVMTDGRLAAFIGPVGMLSSAGIGAAGTREVLGWDMAVGDDGLQLRATLGENLPAPWSACSGMSFGTSGTFAPVVLPVTHDALVLARTAPDGPPCVLFAERPDRKLFWSAIPGLRPKLLRALADAAGLPVISRDDLAVFAGCGFVGLHCREAGSYTIQLPQPSVVTELLTGRKWPAETRQIEFELKAGDTSILRCIASD